MQEFLDRYYNDNGCIRRWDTVRRLSSNSMSGTKLGEAHPEAAKNEFFQA